MFFCDKGIAILRTKFGSFLALKQSVWHFFGLFSALFGFLLKFSSGNPGCDEVCFLDFGGCLDTFRF